MTIGTKDRTTINDIYKILIMAGLVLGLLAGCSSGDEVTPDVTPTVAREQTLEIDDEQEQTDQVSLEITEEPEIVVDECLVCHSNEERLKDTAAPVVDLESESSGEG
jgi:hypothetical protein